MPKVLEDHEVSPDKRGGTGGAPRKYNWEEDLVPGKYVLFTREDGDIPGDTKVGSVASNARSWGNAQGFQVNVREHAPDPLNAIEIRLSEDEVREYNTSDETDESTDDE